MPFDIPTLAYENEKEVPKEFLVKNPKEIPSRVWGQLPQEKDVLLPVIDMYPLISRAADPEGTKKVIEEIGHACEEWGYFQAYNHGVPESLMDGILEATGEFFRLPLDEKCVYAIKPGGSEGYGRLGANIPTRVRHWSDMLRHTVRPKLSPDEIEKRIPAKPPQYRALIEEFTQEVEKLQQVVWAALNAYLDLQTTTLQEPIEKDSTMVIRANYYPKCPEPEKVLGLPAHQDYGSMTVLLQDQVGGLQLTKPNTPGDEVWLDIKPIKGSLFVKMGKQVEHLTNGRIKAVLHRALVNRNERRVSIAAFLYPGPECIIKPIQEILDKYQEAPRFKQLRFGDYHSGVKPHASYEVRPGGA